MIVFHWSLSDSKSPRVPRTVLCILADLNNAVVWMMSTRPLIFKSSSPCTNPLVPVPSALITIGITVTFMFHSFFSSLAFCSLKTFYARVSLWAFTKVWVIASLLRFPRLSSVFDATLVLLWYGWSIIIIIDTPFRVFHTSVSRGFLTGVWMTASLFKSPGLFSVF